MARWDVYIDGHGYILDAEYGDKAYTEEPQEGFIGKDADTFWQDWTMRSFHGGERQAVMLGKQDEQNYQYHDGEGVLMHTFGEWTLQPALTRGLAIQSASLPMTVTSDGTKIIIGLDESPYIKLFTGGSFSNPSGSVAGSGTVTDLITVGSTLYGVRGGGVITSTDGGNNWSAVGSYTTATALAVVNQKLYVGKSSGGVYNHTDDEDTTTVGTVTSMCDWREDLVWIEDRRLWRYNGKVAFVYDILPSGFNGLCLFPYRQVLFILGYYKEQGGYRGAVYFIYAGNENHLYSVGDFNADNRVYAACGGDDEVWFANQSRGGADRYDLTFAGLTPGPAWAAQGHIPFKSMAYSDGYLLIGRYDNVAGTDGVYVADVSSPSAYRSSSWFTSSEWDFDFANDEKLLGSIGIYHRPLLSGQRFQMEYSLDGGDTWNLAGLSEGAGNTKRVYEFKNLRFDSIKLKVTTTGPGTSTPKGKKILVRACAVSQAKWLWRLRLLADRVQSRGGRVRKGYEAVANLKAASDKQLPVPFIDRIGNPHSVIVETCEIDQRAESKRQAFLYAQLREV